MGKIIHTTYGGHLWDDVVSINSKHGRETYDLGRRKLLAYNGFPCVFER